MSVSSVIFFFTVPVVVPCEVSHFTLSPFSNLSERSPEELEDLELEDLELEELELEELEPEELELEELLEDPFALESASMRWPVTFPVLSFSTR